MKHLLLLFCIVLSWVARSQSYWETLTPPPGGAPETLTETVNGWIYAEFYDHSVYCSKDQGESWEQIFWPSNDPDTGFLQITVGRKGRLFGERKLAPPAQWGDPQRYDVFSSDDNGMSWQLLLDSTTLHGINQSQQGALFAIRELGDYLSEFLRSDDAGMNWIYLADAYETVNLSIKVNIYGHLVVNDPISSVHIWFSKDNGQSWKYLSTPGNSTRPTFTKAGTLLMENFDAIWRLEYDATAYEIIPMNVIVPAEDYPIINSLMELPNGDILGNSPTYLIRSTDDGHTWTPLPPHHRVYLLIGPGGMQNGDIFCNRIGETMYRSQDLGQNWTFSGNGIARGDMDYLYLHSDSCWLSMSDPGLWKTVDQGRHWELLKAARHPFTWPTMDNDMAWDNAGNVVARIDDTLFYTVNQGLTWQTFPMPDLHPRLLGLAMHRTQPVIFLNSGAGLARSDNGGQSWTIVTDSLYLGQLLTHPNGNLYAVLMREIKTSSGQNGYTRPTALYRSADNGLSWTMILDERIQSLAINSTGELYAVGTPTQTFRSADGGANWSILPYRGRNIYCNSANQLIAHDNSKSVFISNNRGENWQELPKALDLSFFSHYASAFDAQNRFYTSIWEYPSQHHFLRSSKPTSEGAFLSGQVFKDTDDDCNTLEDSVTLAGWILKAEGAGDTWWANTDSTGHFYMFVDTGTYRLSLKPGLKLYWETCADSILLSVPELYDTTFQDMRVKAVADCPYIAADIAAPWLERCFESYVFVNYCNLGTERADSAWVDVLLDPHLTFTDTLHVLPHAWVDSSTLRFYLGALPEGYCDAFSFRVYVDCDSTVIGQSICLTVHAFPDSVCFETPGWSGAEIRLSAECQQDTALAFHVTNAGTEPTQSLQYYVIEDDVVMLHGTKTYNPGETQTYVWPANGHFRRFESDQEPGHPFSKQVAASVEGCGGLVSLGFPNQYFLNSGIPAISNYCGTLVGAFDPNDKQGFPIGYGDEHYINPNGTIDYLIRFQNTGTAPAHRVVVLDTLSALLDPATLRMGVASHPFTWKLKGPGILEFSFDNIELPDSNSNEAASHGFVHFKIAQQPNLPDGSLITNSASIYFDFNLPVRTNLTRHRIGTDFMEVLDVTTPPDQAPLTVRVSPNPAGAGALLYFEGLESGNYRLLVRDLSGQSVRELDFDGKTLHWAGDDRLNGLYFFQIVDEKGAVAGKGKVVFHPNR